MISFKEWLTQQEMWFAPDSSVQINKRKPNKGFEGQELPKSMAPQPPNMVPGSKGAGPNGGTPAAGAPPGGAVPGGAPAGAPPAGGQPPKMKS